MGEGASEPLWRLHSFRHRLAQETLASGPTTGWKAVAAFPVSLDVGCDDDDAPLAMRKVSTQAEVEKQAGAALREISKRDGRLNAKFILQQAIVAASHNDFNGAVAHLQSVFTFPEGFPLKGSQIGLRVWQGELTPSEAHCPCVQLRVRKRKYNRDRAKILFLLLDIHRLVLPQNVDRTDVKRVADRYHDEFVAFAGRGDRSSFDIAGVDKIVQRGLLSRTPASWKAVIAVQGLMVAVARGVKAKPSNSFWTSFHGWIVHALRVSFMNLLYLGRPHDGNTPMVDWQLLAMMRSCCLGLDGAGGETINEVSSLRRIYLGFLAQLYEAAGGATGGRAKTFDEAWTHGIAERVFKRLRAAFPDAEVQLWGCASEERADPLACGASAVRRSIGGLAQEVIAIDDF